MSADEFWKDDPQLFVSYRTSFINKKKREMEEMDYNCWLQGLYNFDGNSKLNGKLIQTLANMFSSKKDNTKIESYTNKPYQEIAKDNINKQKQKEKEINYRKYENSLVYYGTLKQQYIEKMKKKGE